MYPIRLEQFGAAVMIMSDDELDEWWLSNCVFMLNLFEGAQIWTQSFAYLFIYLMVCVCVWMPAVYDERQVNKPKMNQSSVWMFSKVNLKSAPSSIIPA